MSDDRVRLHVEASVVSFSSSLVFFYLYYSVQKHPGLMKVRINSMPNKNKNLWY